MLYLFIQTWIWILAAGLLGLLVGWWIWGRGAAAASPDDADRKRLEQQLADCRARCESLESRSQPGAGAMPEPEPAPASESAAAPTDDEIVGDKQETSLSEDWRPSGLSAPRDGTADDLKRIRGIGPVIERTLNELGIFHFDQIAAFDDDNIRWVDNYIAFPGRILREQWVSQAAELAGGGQTEFSNRYDRDDNGKK